jgi:cysteine desulfuration protein SufE
MSTAEFNAIVEDFDFIDDWEDRYRYIIEKGKSMPSLDDALKVEATKVHGCASQVWMHSIVEQDTFYFEGDSDAIIVRGLISLLKSLYSGLPVSEVANINAVTELNRLGLTEHLSSQRSNGLNAMVTKIKKTAEDELSKR